MWAHIYSDDTKTEIDRSDAIVLKMIWTGSVMVHVAFSHKIFSRKLSENFCDIRGTKRDLQKNWTIAAKRQWCTKLIWGAPLQHKQKEQLWTDSMEPSRWQKHPAGWPETWLTSCLGEVPCAPFGEVLRLQIARGNPLWRHCYSCEFLKTPEDCSFFEDILNEEMWLIPLMQEEVSWKRPRLWVSVQSHWKRWGWTPHGCSTYSDSHASTDSNKFAHWNRPLKWQGPGIPRMS